MSFFKKVAGFAHEAASRGLADRAHAVQRYEREHRSELSEEQSAHLRNMASENKMQSEILHEKAKRYKE